MARPARKLSADTRLKFRLRKICSGRMGSAARLSIQMNASTESTDTTPSPVIWGESQAYWVPPQVAPSTIAVAATASRAAPT
jgi:hypothetical protein